MNDITLSVVGNVVNDVDLRFTPSGEAVASFRVASTTRRFDRNKRAVDRWGYPLLHGKLLAANGAQWCV